MYMALHRVLYIIVKLSREKEDHMSEIVWKKQAFSIAFETNSKRGTREVEGTVAESTGLGYYWTYDEIRENVTIDVIGITHLASGRAIPVPTVRTEIVAKAWIRELAAMPIDWTLPMEQLIASPGYGKIPVKCRELAAMIGQVVA